jgi:hypothetical protein
VLAVVALTEGVLEFDAGLIAGVGGGRVPPQLGVKTSGMAPSVVPLASLGGTSAETAILGPRAIVATKVEDPGNNPSNNPRQKPSKRPGKLFQEAGSDCVPWSDRRLLSAGCLAVSDHLSIFLITAIPSPLRQSLVAMLQRRGWASANYIIVVGGSEVGYEASAGPRPRRCAMR